MFALSENESDGGFLGLHEADDDAVKWMKTVATIRAASFDYFRNRLIEATIIINRLIESVSK